MSYRTTDGTFLYVARMRADERAVVIVREDGRAYETPVARESLFDPKIAAHPQAGLAVVARSATAFAYGCLVGDREWTLLGRSNQPCGVRFAGVLPRFAWIGPGGSTLNERGVGSEGTRVRPANTSQGILDWDEFLNDWRIASNRDARQVGPYALIKSVQRAGWVLGQVVNPDRLVLVNTAGTRYWRAAAQAESPNLVVIGDRLIVNGGVEFRPPYPPNEVLTAPQPSPEPPKETSPVDPRIDLLEKWRAFYDDEQPGVRRGFLISNAYAWDRRAEGFGLLDKRSPTGSTYAYDGKHFPSDIVVLQNGDHFDVLGDGDGVATPTFQAKGKIPAAWRWVPPYDPAVFGAAPQPPEPPQPPPPPPAPPAPVVDLTDVVRRLDAIDATLTASAAREREGLAKIDVLGSVIAGLANGVLDIRTQQDRPYEGRVFGAKVTLIPKEAPSA